MHIDLGSQLGFAREDLDANREGYLSDIQRTNLRRVLLRDTLLYGLFALLPLGALVLLLNDPGVCGGPITLVILALLSAAFVVYSVRLNRSTRADLAGTVSAAAGQVDLSTSGRGFYRLTIGQQS